MPRKGAINYAGIFDWFREKSDSLYKERKTFCRAKHGSKAELTQEPIREEGAKNMAYFEHFGRLQHKHAFIVDRIAPVGFILVLLARLGRLQIGIITSTS